MIGHQNDIDPLNIYSSCIWVYITAPFVGALLAAVFNQYHQGITDAVDEHEKNSHHKKLSESRSVDKIDVQDTRSQ